MQTHRGAPRPRQGARRLWTAAVLAGLGVLAGGCGAAAAPPAKAPAAAPAHHHGHAAHARRGGVLRITAVSGSQVSLSHGRHHTTAPTSLAVYFEGARVSASWLHAGERVRRVGTAASPTALELLPSVAGTVQQVSSAAITVRTAKGKTVALALPSPVVSANLTWPPAAGTKVALVAGPAPTNGQQPIAFGIAAQPSVAHGQFVSRTGSKVVVAINGHDSASIPFLGAAARLAKLKPGQTLTVWDSAAGQPLAVP